MNQEIVGDYANGDRYEADDDEDDDDDRVAKTCQQCHPVGAIFSGRC